MFTNRKVLITIIVILIIILIGLLSFNWYLNNKVVSPSINNESQNSSMEGLTVVAEASLQEISNQPTVTVDDKTKSRTIITDVNQMWGLFTNPNGGYTFNHPANWNPVVSQYNNKSSFFGVDATAKAGEGGVEVINYKGTLEEYLNNMEQNAEIRYLDRENIINNGIPGIRTNFKGFPVSGYSVFLKKGDQIYNVYINKERAGVIEEFDKLVASFYFSD